MIILAQLPAATPSEIGHWLIAGAALLSIVALFKSVFVRQPSLDATFLTKKEGWAGIASAKREAAQNYTAAMAKCAGHEQTINDQRLETNREMQRLWGKYDEINATLSAHSEAIRTLKERTNH